MKIKIFSTNKEGKIVLSKEELEELLKEAYEEGKDSISESSPVNPYFPSCLNCPYFPTLYRKNDFIYTPNIQIEGQISFEELQKLKLEVQNENFKSY